MKIVIGLDVGTSTTKILAMNEAKEILYTERVSASEQLTSLFGAVGSLLYKTGLRLDQVCRFMTTGVGASFIEGDILGIPTSKVPEIEAMGEGGLFLAGVDKAIVTSFGTGTTFAAASFEEGVRHVGGIAMGGGTLSGLAARLFGIDRFEDLAELASRGNIYNVDKSMKEISHDQVSNLPDFATASNLAKVRANSRDEDVAIGLFNMLYQAAGTMAVLCADHFGTDQIVAVGSLATLDMAGVFLGQVGQLYERNFIIPQHAAYAPAAGAALRAF